MSQSKRKAGFEAVRTNLLRDCETVVIHVVSTLAATSVMKALFYLRGVFFEPLSLIPAMVFSVSSGREQRGAQRDWNRLACGASYVVGAAMQLDEAGCPQ